jgi:hypothetical protein
MPQYNPLLIELMKKVLEDTMHGVPSEGDPRWSVSESTSHHRSV